MKIEINEVGVAASTAAEQPGCAVCGATLVSRQGGVCPACADPHSPDVPHAPATSCTEICVHAEPPAKPDRTLDGREIQIGLRVFTNDGVWGTVCEAPNPWHPGWWMVRIDEDAGWGMAGERHLHNGPRMAARAPGA